jgi:hypothetical protein
MPPSSRSRTRNHRLGVAFLARCLAADAVNKVERTSGDLAVTIGIIRLNTPPAAGEPAAFPFFTVWQRASPAEPWRYVAE